MHVSSHIVLDETDPHFFKKARQDLLGTGFISLRANGLSLPPFMALSFGQKACGGQLEASVGENALLSANHEVPNSVQEPVTSK